MERNNANDQWITGWWFGCHQFYFPIYWVANHPNWLSYFSIFFRGVQTTNQITRDATCSPAPIMKHPWIHVDATGGGGVVFLPSPGTGMFLNAYLHEISLYQQKFRRLSVRRLFWWYIRLYKSHVGDSTTFPMVPYGSLCFRARAGPWPQAHEDLRQVRDESLAIFAWKMAGFFWGSGSKLLGLSGDLTHFPKMCFSAKTSLKQPKKSRETCLFFGRVWV